MGSKSSPSEEHSPKRADPSRTHGRVRSVAEQQSLKFLAFVVSELKALRKERRHQLGGTGNLETVLSAFVCMLCLPIPTYLSV